MINWIDIILIIILSAAGIYGLIKVNLGENIFIMTANGLALALSIGFYEYLGAIWGDTSFTHGVSLLMLFILSILVFIAGRKRVNVVGSKGQLKYGSHPRFDRIISGFVLVLSAAILIVIVMALMVKVAAWMLESDELSRTSEIFINGVIGSEITRGMDRLAGYPAIIVGAVVTVTGIIVSNTRFFKRLSDRRIN